MSTNGHPVRANALNRLRVVTELGASRPVCRLEALGQGDRRDLAAFGGSSDEIGPIGLQGESRTVAQTLTMSEYRLGVGRTNLCGSLEKQVKLVALPRNQKNGPTVPSGRWAFFVLATPSDSDQRGGGCGNVTGKKLFGFEKNGENIVPCEPAARGRQLRCIGDR